MRQFAPDEQELTAVIRGFRSALLAISEMGGLTLIAPSLGPECDRAHQIGANKAFDQCADIAKAALERASKL
jgi:hypothetical protein